MVGDDDLHPEATRLLDLGRVRHATVAGDEERHAGGGEAFEAAEGEAVTLGQP